VALVLLAGGMLLRGWLWQHEVAPFLHVTTGEGNFFERFVETIYNPTYARLDGLLAGVMLAVVQLFRPRWWSWAVARAPWFLAAGLLAVLTAMGMDTPGLMYAVVGFPLLSAGLAAIVLASASPSHWAATWRVPGAAPLAAMGFSLYLVHKSVFSVLHSAFGPQLREHGLLALLVYCAAAMAVGGLLYLAVERPFMRLRGRLLKRKPPAGAEKTGTGPMESAR
jgi:peptidoglycan/LPS O-acetylase OafA/YrhL